MTVKIFVEGIADIKFLSDYISFKYGVQLMKDDIIETKGWTNIKSDESHGGFVRNKMLQNSDDEGVNLLIFDADSDYNDRFKEITDWRTKSKLDFEIFLWPDNSNAGDLEVVLEKIINIKNAPIFECWGQYESCLKTKSIEGRTSPLTTPTRKTKIYGYLEALLGESKSQKKQIKELYRDYKRSDFWDLNSEYLNPLKYFLDKYIK